MKVVTCNLYSKMQDCGVQAGQTMLRRGFSTRVTADHRINVTTPNSSCSLTSPSWRFILAQARTVCRERAKRADESLTEATCLWSTSLDVLDFNASWTHVFLSRGHSVFVSAAATKSYKALTPDWKAFSISDMAFHWNGSFSSSYECAVSYFCTL